MANKDYNGFLSINEYLSLAYSHGLSNLERISEEICVSAQILKNWSCGRTRLNEKDQRYLFLDAKVRGWV